MPPTTPKSTPFLCLDATRGRTHNCSFLPLNWQKLQSQDSSVVIPSVGNYNMSFVGNEVVSALIVGFLSVRDIDIDRQKISHREQGVHFDSTFLLLITCPLEQTQA